MREADVIGSTRVLSSSAKRNRPTAFILAVTMAAAPFAAFAGPAEDKATARELAKEGIAAEQKGDCATAIDRLERAESLYHAPPHLQFLARCYGKVGRLVDAAETWRRLTLEPIPANAPPAFKDAMAEAKAELPKIEPRLGHLTLKAAQKYDGFAAEVDGKAWPAAALDVPRIIDPGKHLIRARATGYKTTESSVDVGEGKSESVTLTLEAGVDPGGVPPVASTTASTNATATAAPSVTAVPTATTTATTDPPRGSSPVKTIGFVTFSVGVAALAGGVVVGLIGTSKFNSLKADCTLPKRCVDASQRADAVDRLELTANVLYATGGILAAAGLTMVLLAPSRKDTPPPVALQFSPAPSGGHVLLTGSF
jgi:hypothetical protein